VRTAAAVGLCLAAALSAGVYNLKVVTDASPDYSDVDSLLHSATANWQTPAEKVWALFYWNHIARRQMRPMVLHGLALTDPIRQFNDYGFTMCSTVSGINCSLWDALGLRAKYWDITNHTVAEVEYGGAWHMVDNSLSALYTLCDGVTLAGVADIGATRACPASGDRAEPGHVARYHCLTATSANGFLTGADCARSLEEEYRCFNPNGLKYRAYYYDWDRGHRFILNLRETEVYTRHYVKLGDTAEYYVPNGGTDPDDKRFLIRGNGVRTFSPRLTAASLEAETDAVREVAPLPEGGLVPTTAGKAGEAVFRIEGANVITHLKIRATDQLRSDADRCTVAFSTTAGLHWLPVWEHRSAGGGPTEVSLTELVSGAYEVLVRVTLLGQAAAGDAVLRSIAFETTTMVNAKALPRLDLGRNTVYVGNGEPYGSTVLWPDLRADHYKALVVAESNVAAAAEHPGYQGTLYAARPGEDAWIEFRLDTPGEMVHVHSHGRLYNRAPGSRIEFRHSFDNGTTWATDYALTDTEMPWDVLHEVTVEAPRGVRSVLLRYVLRSQQAGPGACSLYAVRMEANYRLSKPGPDPLDVTFAWSEVADDGALRDRSHTQRVTTWPTRYPVCVGGVDHPRMRFLRVAPAGTVPDTKEGYSDGVDAGGERTLPQWVTYGRNLALGRPYTVSVPSNDRWGAGDPEGRKLTDGVVGPPFAGGIGPSYALGWDDGMTPEVTVDLGAEQTCAAVRIHLGGGWPWWDGFRGEVRDGVEVLTSTDGQAYASHGKVPLNLRRKDIPINHMLPDDESLGAHLYPLTLPQPVAARYVRFRVTARRSLCVSEVEVLDAASAKPFDLRIALPDERGTGMVPSPRVLTAAGRPVPARVAEANAARPVGEPVLEPPTLHSLGAYWVIDGDADDNARVDLACRAVGATEWRPCLPLFRVARGAHRNDKGASLVEVPESGRIFAGSALFLTPGTEYELRLRLADGGGPVQERVLRARTLAEPLAPADLVVRHVVPGDGGGAGTEAEPFRGLAAAQAEAQPGTLFLVHAGRYPGTFEVTRSGEAGRPIVWRAAGDGDVLLDSRKEGAAAAGRTVSACGVHDVWFEGLTIRGADYGVVLHESARCVVRGCRIRDVNYGITATRNDAGTLAGLFLADNVLEGPSTWPRSKGIEDARGIQVSGTGQVICYNRIRGFADAIDTFPSPGCAAIDIHNNDIAVMTDDGIELDYSERNTRCFLNRITNTFTGISAQPVLGGPAYAVRNVLFNQVYTPFKLHNRPSGFVAYHNTAVKAGMPLAVMTNAPVRNALFRNNLFIGTEAPYAFESTARMEDCDVDWDGFGGGPWARFLKWNETRYANAAEVRAKCPAYRHVVVVDTATLFASGATAPRDPNSEVTEPPDLRLAAGSGAVDAGEVLPEINDGFAGKAPDLGAYELGTPLPHYGPRLGQGQPRN